MKQSSSIVARNWTLALLFLTGVLNLFDRQIINVLAQDIKLEFGISDAKLGLLTGTAFGLLYSLAIIPLARIADRSNRVTVVASALAAWSFFTAVCGAAANFIQLFLARMGVGIGEAGCQPASVSIVADLYPAERRTFATAILLVGAPIGACLGLLLGGYVASNWGWRRALFVAALPGFIVAALLFLTVRDPAPAHLRQPQSAGLGSALTLLGRTPSLRWLTLAFACQTFGLFATGAWLPIFFMRAHALAPVDVGLALGLAVGIGGSLGALGIGFLCDRFRRSGRPIDWQLAMLALALNVPLALATATLPNLSLALVTMFLLNMTVYAYLGPVPVLIQQQAAIGSKSLALGGVTAVANILSMCLGVPAVGLLSDVLDHHFAGRAVGIALSIALTIAAALGVAALSQAQRAAQSRLLQSVQLHRQTLG